ncbi:MAG: hypothetical protein BM556_03375 [Bacteriovorax sp. MedPE-SWde]|nr:MAG: hypothetical protein BM556_03375 [Bacteriovorax sp. MedPE-SWde]
MGQLKEKYIYIFFFLITVFSFSIIFVSPDNIGINDFDHNFTNILVSIKSIFQEYEFPLWNPYDHGGIPLLGQAYSSSLSPFNILFLVFPALIALKIKILICSLLCCFTSYRYLKDQVKDNLSATCGAILFTFSSYNALNITQGQYEFMTMWYIPILFLTYKNSDLKSSIIFSISVVMMLFEGAVYNIVISLLSIFILIVFQRLKNLKEFIKKLLLAFLLGAIKLFPSINLMSLNNRQIYDISGFSLYSFIHSLINRGQKVYYSNNLEVFYEAVSNYIGLDNSFGLISGIDSGWDEHGMFIGIIPLFLILASVVYSIRKKKYVPQIGLLIITILISFGYRLPLGPWKLLNMLPVLENMRHPTRFRVITLLIFSVFICFAIKKISEYLSKRFSKRVAYSLCVTFVLLLSIDLSLMTRRILGDAFIYPNFTKLERGTSLNYVESWQKNKDYLITTEEGYYPAFLENKGLIFKKETQNFKIATLAKTNESYKGEVYSLDENVNPVIKSRTNNSISINLGKVSSKKIILNQNYFSGWSADSCNVVNHKGLIALEKCRDKNVYLSYLPNSFILGLAISIITSIVLMLISFGHFQKFSMVTLRRKFRDVL